MKPSSFFYCLFLFLICLLASQQISAQYKRQGSRPAVVNKTTSPQQSNYKIEQFFGKWQEISRTGKQKSKAAITDTLLIQVTEPDKVETREGTKNIIKGNISIEPGDILVVAADVYEIISVTEKQLVLDDQEGFIHTFAKTDLFTYETYGKNTVTAGQYDKPVSFTLADIQGKWFVYKKEAKPGVIAQETLLIKEIKINPATGETSAGEITFYNYSKTETQPCTVSIKNNYVVISAGGHEWKYLVYKISATEWIFGNHDELMYHAKPVL